MQSHDGNIAGYYEFDRGSCIHRANESFNNERLTFDGRLCTAAHPAFQRLKAGALAVSCAAAPSHGPGPIGAHAAHEPKRTSTCKGAPATHK